MGDERMPSRTHVVTNTYLPDVRSEKNITTVTSTFSDGDTPLEKQTAGYTAGMVGQGNAMAHGRYMAEVGKIIVERKEW